MNLQFRMEFNWFGELFMPVQFNYSLYCYPIVPKRWEHSWQKHAHLTQNTETQIDFRVICSLEKDKQHIIAYNNVHTHIRIYTDREIDRKSNANMLTCMKYPFSNVQIFDIIWIEIWRRLKWYYVNFKNIESIEYGWINHVWMKIVTWCSASFGILVSMGICLEN